MNLADLPQLLGNALLLAAAGWFVLRRRGRPAVWAMAGLVGLAVYSTGFMVAVAAGADLHPARAHTRAMVFAAYGFLGLLFAAVFVDRRRGTADG